MHPRLQSDAFRFCLLGSHGEALKKPFEDDWPRAANYRFDDTKITSHRGNIGICGGYGDILVLDSDDLSRWEEMGILSLIPSTFTVESRSGHRQFYVTCSEHFQSGGLYDPERTDTNHEGKPEYVHIGDIKGVGGQAVTPGSKHPSGSIYNVVADLPIAEVTPELVRSIIGKFKRSKKFNGNFRRLDDTISQARKRKYGQEDPFSSLQVKDIMPPEGKVTQNGDELRGDHPIHGSTNGGNYCINTAKNLWHCMRCESGGGPALAIAVKEGLISCSDAAPGVLRGDLFKQVLKIAQEKYGLPGSGPKGEEQEGPTVIDALRSLAGVCDGARSQDCMGFSKFDRESYNGIIEKAISCGDLSSKEEKTAYRFLKKYKKQLKVLGIDYDQIGHIAWDGECTDDGLAKINDRIPIWIEEYHFKTVSDTERLYHYDHGVYLDDGEVVLKALIEKEFGDFTDNRMVSDIVGKVKRRTYVDRDLFNNRHVVNVRNGLLDLETLEIKPHTPDYLSTAQINVAYNKNAKAPRIQKFLNEVAQSGDIVLIEEIIGWLLWPDYNVHKALMLIGCGRNGKGTLLRLITAFLGKKSISNVTLQDLVADRFAKVDLYGKLANIGGDLPSKDLSDTAAFRNLTGGDDNRAQEKYRPAFNFRNKAKMMFSANVLPKSPDDTYAFYSRWILLEFSRIFDPQKGTGDPDLDAKLQTDEELSGLLNIALAGLKRLRANSWKFSYDKSVEGVEQMYKRNANPVYAFLLDECEPGDATDYIEKTLFYNCFKEYAIDHGIRPLSSKKFSELLKDQTEVPVSSARPGSGWDRPVCWQGIKFKKGSRFIEKINGVTSRKSRVQPTPSSRQNESEKDGEEKEKEGKIGIRKTLDFLDVKEDDCGLGPHPRRSELTPATKSRLWRSIGSKLKKIGRKDQARHGLAVSDLSPGELELIMSAGWQQETTNTGITILWAPEKTLKALAVTA